VDARLARRLIPSDFRQLEAVYRSCSFEMCGKKLFVWGLEDFAEFFPTDFVGAFDCLP
jgi:hypothetical protein